MITNKLSTVTALKLLRQRNLQAAFFSEKCELPKKEKVESVSDPDFESKPKGWISKLLTGQHPDSESGQRQSHSSMLSVGDVICELQTHDAIGGRKEEYLKYYKNYAEEIQRVTPGAELFGSWSVLFGNQDQVINLWRYKNGFADIDSNINALQRNTSLKSAELDYAKVCGRRRTVVTKPFSYWGDMKARDPSHIYDLRSYVLRPGSMIEWGNAWSKGITYRRDYNQDVAGFFSQVGQLYMVFHIWAYKDMCGRNTTRQHTWSKPGWDSTVAITVGQMEFLPKLFKTLNTPYVAVAKYFSVPLIKKMQSKILVPTELSKLQ